jgi:hypothetical protein
MPRNGAREVRAGGPGVDARATGGPGRIVAGPTGCGHTQPSRLLSAVNLAASRRVLFPVATAHIATA